MRKTNNFIYNNTISTNNFESLECSEVSAFLCVSLMLDGEGPLIFISNRSFMELFPRDVRLALFTMFMWLNPLSTIGFRAL